MTNPPDGAESRGVRRLTEGALLAALTVVLVLAANFVPLLGVIPALFIPTPVAVLVYRHDVRTALMSSLVAGLLLFGFVGLFGAVLGSMHAAGLGLPLGYGLRRSWPAWRTITVTTLTILAVGIVSMTATLAVMGVHPLEVAERTYREAGDWAFSVFESAGMTPGIGGGEGGEEAFLETWNAMIDAAMLLLPVGILFGYTAYALVSYGLNCAVLRRLGGDAPEIPPFARWRVPDALIYAFALALALLWGLQFLGFTLPPAVAENVLYAFIVVFSVQGAAAGYAWLRRWGVSRALAAGILLLVAMTGLVVAYVWIGILEALFRFRDRWMDESPEGRVRP